MCLGLDKKPYISTLGDSTWIAYAENQGLSQLHYNRCVDLLYTDNGWKIFKCCIELNLAVQLNETAQQSFWCVRDKLIFFTRAFWWLRRYIFGRLQSLLPMDFQRKPSPPNREAQSGVQTPSTLWHTKEVPIQSDGCYFSKYLLTLCDMYKTFNFCKLRMGFKRSIWL